MSNTVSLLDEILKKADISSGNFTVKTGSLNSETAHDTCTQGLPFRYSSLVETYPEESRRGTSQALEALIRPDRSDPAFSLAMEESEKRSTSPFPQGCAFSGLRPKFMTPLFLDRSEVTASVPITDVDFLGCMQRFSRIGYASDENHIGKPSYNFSVGTATKLDGNIQSSYFETNPLEPIRESEKNVSGNSDNSFSELASHLTEHDVTALEENADEHVKSMAKYEASALAAPVESCGSVNDENLHLTEQDQVISCPDFSALGDSKQTTAGVRKDYTEGRWDDLFTNFGAAAISCGMVILVRSALSSAVNAALWNFGLSVTISGCILLCSGITSWVFRKNRTPRKISG